MTKDNDKPRFNVYIIKNNGETMTQIGTNLTEAKADQREITGLQRIDRANYFIGVYEVDGDQDKECQEVLKAKIS